MKRAAAALTLLSLFGTFSQGAEEQTFEITGLRSARIARYRLLEVRFRSQLDRNEGVAVKIYALYRKGTERGVLLGTYSFLLPFGKGLHEVFGHVTPSEVVRYGRLEKWRAEIWQKGKLLAGKNQPRLEEEPWWKGRYQVIGRIRFGLSRKMLEELDDDDD